MVLGIEKFKNHDKEILINKILNEIKFNKRLIYNWSDWFDSDSQSDVRKFIKSEIDIVLKTLQQKTFSVGKIDAIPLYKGLSNEDQKTQTEDEPTVISFASDKRIEPNKVEYNYFIKTSFQDFILGAVWIETIGKLIDSTFSCEVYANRISQTNFSFFKPYYSAYSSFRDSSFSKMKTWVEDNDTGVFVQTDLTRCFYHFNIEQLKEKVDGIFIDIIKLDSKLSYTDIDTLKYINQCVFQIIDQYNKLQDVKIIKENKGFDDFLPIGFLPSAILVNLYLTDLDREIKNLYNPVQYGRYVDDIAFLIKKDVSINEQKDVVKSICNTLKIISERDALSNKNIHLNISKTIIFLINEKNDKNFLNKFERETQILSSDSFRLIDPQDFEEEFNDAYSLTKDITKLSDMFTITRDKKHISRMISTIYYYIYSSLKDSKHSDITSLSGKFIEFLYSFVDDEFFLDLYDYWNFLMVIELVSLESPSVFIKGNAINKLKIFTKIREMKFRYEDLSFIKRYENILIKLFYTKQESLLSKIQQHLRLPKYKNEIAFENAYLLNYELQLRKLWKIINKISQDEEDIYQEFIDYSKNSWNVKKDGFLEYEPKNKFVVGQSNFYDYKDRREFFLKNVDNLSNLSDIIEIQNQSNKEKVDILLYPEQGVSIQDLANVIHFGVKTKTMIIGGLDFIFINGYIFNLTFIVKPIKKVHSGKEYRDAILYLIPKIYPSPEEYETFHNSRPKLPKFKNWEMYIPSPEDWREKHTIYFRGSSQAVLNCYEATSMDLKYEISKNNPEIVHLITNNRDIKYYFQIAENLSRDLMSISTITNYSKLGGVEVYAPYKLEYRRQITMHKGSKNTHIDICEINIDDIISKRYDNLNEIMKQNPPKYYYGNIRGY
ncbi:RNA-directed DNA polymerase [Streptococcus pluranimalium]|uniref:Reverse transcriptase domain-containing protein n=1 Tax=Streptococcus pluranimalium TaxID=82348 RepID=A0A2L0D255_9STRE|nr:RNA-directed DNA polymerase [Streptococcus pluranimalium]AUW95700.1 hypothetical protein C0J00_00370 [Streptococcus pluranimalium]